LFARIGADKNEVVDLDNYVFFNKLFEVDNNLEVVENIVYENLEDLIDGLKECNVTKDYIFEAEKFYNDCIASCE
jgi:hypothetical protein